MIDRLSSGLPVGLEELATLHLRHDDVLGLLRPSRLQRTNTGHKRLTRSTAPQRRRLPRPDQLSDKLFTALRSPYILKSARPLGVER
jgi:hypothetical protein